MADEKSLTPIPTPEEDPCFLPDVYVGSLPPTTRYCRGWNSKRAKYCRAWPGLGTSHRSVGRCKFHGGNNADRTTHGRFSTIKDQTLRELIEEFEADPDLLDLESDVAATRALFVDFINRYNETTEALLAWHASWQLRNVQLPEDKIQAFERVVDEWEITLREGHVEATDKQLAEIQDARKFIDFMHGRLEMGAKPRKVLDISDAYRLLESASRIVEKIEKIRAENAISRQEFFRLTDAMGRVVMKHVTDANVLQKIREGWLDIAVA